MKIIIDSNVLFSALLKDSLTRKLILEYEGYFLFPFFIFDELIKHKKYLISKSKIDEIEFNDLLSVLLLKVKIVPKNVLFLFKEKALEIVKDIDVDDVLFFACALAYPGSVIWSDDKKLKNQEVIKIFNTFEMKELFGL